MKGLGLGAAGLGAATATAPIFHDLDEVSAATDGVRDYPWWVKERDYLDPTLEIDWNLLQRWDQKVSSDNFCLTKSTKPELRAWMDENKQNYLDNHIKSKYPEWPGESLRDLALKGAVPSSRYKYQHPKWGGTECFLGIGTAKTPEDYGMPKWNGTPEENTRMVRTAFRFFGATEVGVTELDDKTRKFIFTRNRQQKTSGIYKNIAKQLGVSHPAWKWVEFEDVDQAYETEEKQVIPNKKMWVINWSYAQAFEGTKRAPAAASGSASGLAYQQIAIIECRVQEFLRGLGYQGLAGGTGALAPSGTFPAVDGNGEMGRINFIVAPNFGATVRGQTRVITDLPLAPTKPIDFGLFRFCKTCKICAEACPFDALSFEDEPTWEVPSIGSNPGYKGYFTDYLKCPRCQACMPVCPFSQEGKASVHQVVKATSSFTSIFNGFFTNMESVFGYGMDDPSTWWDVPNMPSYGTDTNIY
jgi:reductive dehalogenase